VPGGEPLLPTEHALTRRRGWFTSAATAVVVITLAALLWWGWRLPAFQSWKAEASPIPFFTVMALLPALGIPIAPFFVLAGATFGIRLGLAGSAAALAVNLLLCHRIGRGRLRTGVARALTRFGYELPAFEGQKAGAVRFTLLVRLTPGLPHFAKNYLLVLAGVPLPMYLLVSSSITGAYGAALIIFGESAFHHDLRGLVLPVLVAGVGALGLWAWRRG
jgi:uncharacterized membrane protein YdjX (TVP38/TMEM64 family)